MENKTVISIETVIDYIEANLDGKLDLEMVAEAVHYSKYHLHRMFTSTVGMTIHDYVQRRQLTEAAKLLVFSDTVPAFPPPARRPRCRHSGKTP